MASLWEDWFSHRHEGSYWIKTLRQEHVWRWSPGQDLCCHKASAWGYCILGEAMEVISKDSKGRMHWWYNDFSHLPRAFAEETPVRTSNLDFKSPEFKETTFLLLSNLFCGPLFQLPQDTNTDYQMQCPVEFTQTSSIRTRTKQMWV